MGQTVVVLDMSRCMPQCRVVRLVKWRRARGTIGRIQRTWMAGERMSATVGASYQRALNSITRSRLPTSLQTTSGSEHLRSAWLAYLLAARDTLFVMADERERRSGAV